MQKFEFIKTKFDGVFLIKPFIVEDNRGFFIKDYNIDVFSSNNVKHDLKETFYTISKPGVVRAIHFQLNHQQAKLIRCLKGRIFDVVVDLRPNSKTYGQYESFELSSENNDQLLIPEFFGHGYLVLEESIVSYKCAEKFYPEDDDGIIWNDEDIGINWPLESVDNLVISERDMNLQSFKEYTRKMKYEEEN